MRFAIVIDKTAGGYGAWVPDVDGVITTGSSVEETLRNMQEAFAFHIEGMLLKGESLPQPATPVQKHWVEVAISAIAQ